MNTSYFGYPIINQFFSNMRNLSLIFLSRLCLSLGILYVSISCVNEAGKPTGESAGEITISPEYIHFWQFKGKPVLLLGGSDDDNLFQREDLLEQLDILQSIGGNYVRNTMSSRDSGNVWPFLQLSNGKYDLNQWEPEYWRRFETLLEETSARDIIVQVEIWATFDFYRDNWLVNPYNPVNNVNYSLERVKLTAEVPTHPVYTENNFFRSVPSHLNLEALLWHQSRFVKKLLSYSLQYNNVLYCMDNETSVTSEWGKFWSLYIQKQARLAGKSVHTTEMWNAWNLANPVHDETFDHPEIYSFVDISQNNHITGQAHWDNGLAQFERLKAMGVLRPVNNVKVYGNDGGRHKTTRNAIESYCQNVLMGCASTRFHRPTSGQGINATARAVIKSLREMTNKMRFFDAKPANELLLNREEHEAYCRAIPGKEYLLFFPANGEVSIDFSDENGTYSFQWMNLLENTIVKEDQFDAGGVVNFTTPGDDYYLLFVKKE